MMTFHTKRDHVEPMLRPIALMVMVLFCLFWTAMALKGIRPRQFAGSDGMIDSTMSFNSFGMMNPKLFHIGFEFFGSHIVLSTGFAFFSLRMTLLSGFACIAFPVTFLISFVFIALIVMFLTGFAPTTMTIFTSRILVELRQTFDFFALGTFFRYDLSRHFRFLKKRLCSEPVASHTLVAGSLIIQSSKGK